MFWWGTLLILFIKQEVEMGQLPEKTFLKPCEIMEAYGMSRPEFRKVRSGLTGVNLAGYIYPKFKRAEVIKVLGYPEVKVLSSDLGR